MRKPIFSFFLLAALVLSAGTGLAQYNTAEIGGVVKDTQGGVLPGATVEAVHASTGFKIERVTGEDGRFFLPGLPIGEYSLSATLQGFKLFARKGLVLRVG